jgi:hypothetical protein
MSNVIIATGYTAQVAYNEETTYGTAPTSGYKWPGQVTEVTGTLNQNPIVIWRLDGLSRYPQYVLQGPREISVDMTFIPQDVVILQDMIQTSALTTANQTQYPVASHSVILNYINVNQGFTFAGLRANQVKIDGKAGDALKVTVNYWGQNVTSGIPILPTAYPTDPANTPFYFSNESVTLNGVLAPRVLDFSVTVSNNLERVYQFGQPFIRVLPPKEGNVTGSMTVTFENLNDWSAVYNMSNYPISIVLDTGTGHTLAINNVKITQIPTPAKPEDLVTIPINFQGFSQPAITVT